jgi:hypothetical protein
MNLTELSRYPKDKVRALFGLTPAALGDLLDVALPESDRRRKQEQANKPNRKRKVGQGRKRLLKPYQEVLLTLVYLRHNVAFCLVGQMFGVSADVAENTFQQKEENRAFSCVRVRVEHSLRRVKAFRIVREEYRLATGLFGRNGRCVVGLVQLLSLTSEPECV